MRTRINGTVPILAFCAFVGMWNLLVLSPLIPLIRSEFELSVGSAGRLVAAAALAASVLLLIAGPMTDFFSRRGLLALGIALLTAGAFLQAVAPSVGSLLALRLVTGLGDAIVLPQTLASVMLIDDEARRTKGVFIISAATGMGAVIGLPVSALVAEASGWRAAFVVLGFVGIVAFATLRFLPRTRSQRPARFWTDYGENVREALSQGNWWLMATGILGATIWYGFIAYVGAFLTDSYALSENDLALILPLFGVSYMGGALLGALLLVQVVRKTTIVIGSAAIGCALLLPLTVVTPHLAYTTALGVLFAACRAPGIAGLQSITLEAIPRAKGTAMSLMQLMLTAGSFVGAAAGGFAIDAGGYGWLGMTYLIASLASIATFVRWTLGRSVVAIPPSGSDVVLPSRAHDDRQQQV